jgi:hypothetical protein
MSGLTSFERRQLRALCDAIVPAGGSIPEGALDVHVPERIEAWLADFSPAARRLVRAMLGGYSLTPLLSSRPRTFAGLGDTQREEWAAESDASRFRLRRDAFMGLHTLVTIAYASTPEVSRHLGWDGSPAKPRLCRRPRRCRCRSGPTWSTRTCAATWSSSAPARAARWRRASWWPRGCRW